MTALDGVVTALDGVVTALDGVVTALGGGGHCLRWWWSLPY